MLIASIIGYGFVNHNHKTGSVEDLDDLVYLIIKHGSFMDFDMQSWHIQHNVCEGFYLTCYDDGFSEEYKTIEELVEALKQLIKGEI